MTQIDIGGKVVEVDDGFLKLSPEDQGKTVDEIASQIGTENLDHPHSTIPSSVARRAVGDIGQGRAEGVQFLRGVPIAGAYADKAAAALNAAAQPIMETGLSKAPSFGERMTENERRIKAGADQYQQENPIKAGVEQFAGGTAAMAPLAASGVAARALECRDRRCRRSGARGRSDAWSRGRRRHRRSLPARRPRDRRCSTRSHRHAGGASWPAQHADS